VGIAACAESLATSFVFAHPSMPGAPGADERVIDVFRQGSGRGASRESSRKVFSKRASISRKQPDQTGGDLEKHVSNRNDLAHK